MKYVDRTCSRVQDDASEGRPLGCYSEHPAWVLLGAAGAGKTEAFKHEAERTDGCYVTARDFRRFDKAEWLTRTLFIDGLDEVRAGGHDGRTPLDDIRAKLDALGRPRFRLSCREADWFGASDRGHLAAVAADGEVLELRLDPLSDDQILEVLAHHDHVACPEPFLRSAREVGLTAMLTTPQGIDVLARAMADSSGGWPESRMETLESACRQLARERNQEHLTAGRPRLAVDELLDAAGRLCAICLLSNHAGFAKATASHSDDYVPLQELPGSQEVLSETLTTPLFTYPDDQCATPMHRQVAEFLAARHLARLIEKGLPPRRVLALATGPDGGIVSGLRGLCAWSAAHSDKMRPECIERDPLGTILYGDVKGFITEQKRTLVESIKRQAERDVWYLSNHHELDVRWGDLATPDAEPIFRDILAAAGRDEASEMLAMSMLAGMHHGSPIPELRGLLIETARDEAHGPQAREAAVDALAKQQGEEVAEQLETLLREVHTGAVSDPTDGLMGTLLLHLYPQHVTPSEIPRYLHEPRLPSFIGNYDLFWEFDIVERSTDDQLAALLDTLVRDWKEPAGKGHRSLHKRLLRAVFERGADVDVRRLWDWLRAMEETWDGTVNATLDQWLQARPEAREELDALATKDSLARQLAWMNQRPPEDGADWQASAKDYASRQMRQRWRSFLLERLANVRDRCPAETLDQFGRIYWGWSSPIGVEGATPDERLRFVFDDDQLREVVLQAILETPTRDDLPDFADVAASDARHPLGRPFLAAVDLMHSETARVDEDWVRLALAFQFQTPERPAWYESMLERRPELVADTLIDYCRIAFRRGLMPPALSAFATPPRPAKVAELAAVDLLRLFPPRGKTVQLSMLPHLLLAALDHCPHEKLAALVERKLSLRGVTAMQRVHWLCCGVTLNASRYCKPLVDALTGRYKHQRIQCVVDLMEGGVVRRERLPASDATVLLQHLAEHCPPTLLVGGADGISEPVWAAARAGTAVRKLLDHLASLSEPAATEALEQLASNAALVRWGSELRHAQTRQRDTRREAEFRAATVPQVLDTLSGKRPANVADLTALVTDRIAAIASRIRDGNTSGWRQYWNTAGKKPVEPKYEELCRDSLLEHLRLELPYADAEPEGVYANDGRADIRVSYGGFNIPIEVKRSMHRDLWRAIRTQLIGKYVQNPGAQGHGIYLVFWFGQDRCQKDADGSKPPRTAAELADRLRQTLTSEERRRIEVIAVDVSPAASATEH